MNRKLFFLFISLIALSLSLVICHLSFVIPVSAFTFSSDSYTIDWGYFNVTSGKKTSDSYNLTDSVGQNAPGKYNSSGYTVKSGFQYIYESSYDFSFRIDDLDINFGTLVADTGTTAQSNLTVSSPAGRGYQILVSQNHPLKNNSGGTIPDTLGDNSLASESVADTWTQNSTYGFGFNASGHGTDSYFSSNSQYRQFADTSNHETPQILASENSPQENRSQTITYKVNVSPIQSSGTYQNAITFIAIPKY